MNRTDTTTRTGSRRWSLPRASVQRGAVTLLMAAVLVVLALPVVRMLNGGGDETQTAPSSAGGSAVGTGAEADAGAADDATFSVFLTEPEALMPPSNVTESEGGAVTTALFSPLVDYDPETSEPLWGSDADTAVADSVRSDDQQTWTITIKDGWTFHDGSPVTARSYVNAWNHGAAHTEYTGNYLFSYIEGYPDVAEADAPADGLSGLEVIDDLTFRVTLTAPFSQFPLTLGHHVFNPVPDRCLDDMDACAEAPVGNGPFMMDGQWRHDEGINVVRYDDWGAGRTAAAGGIDFRIYTDTTTGYADVQAGNLDILDTVPPEQIESAMAEFGDNYLSGNSSSYTYLGLPTFDERFADPDLRHALSMAIDRQAITDTIRLEESPADAMVSPAVAGYREGACGGWCTYDPQHAKQLFDQAGGLEGPATIWFNSGAGHEEWVEAVASQWRENLGITEVNFESLDFAEYLPILQEFEVTGPFRLGWLMDYPSPQNYLENLLYTNGSSNYTGWSNKEFDSLIDRGNAAGDIDQSTNLYHQAEDIALEEMPHIPMFFGQLAGVHSDRVSNVRFNAFETFDYADIKVNPP